MWEINLFCDLLYKRCRKFFLNINCKNVDKFGTIFFLFFFFLTIYSCPRRCAYTILETIFVYIMYSMTQHLDRFYGCCCENKVWYWALFHIPHPTGIRTRHLWDSFRQLLVLASIGSGISTGNGHTLCMPYSLSLHHVHRGQS